MIDTLKICIKFPVFNQSECSVLINVGKIDKEFNVALSDLRCLGDMSSKTIFQYDKSSVISITFEQDVGFLELEQCLK